MNVFHLIIKIRKTLMLIHDVLKTTVEHWRNQIAHNYWEVSTIMLYLINAIQV